MIELSVTSAVSTEPVTVAELKIHLGYPADTSQEALMTGVITAARQWLEGKTALSFVAKNYKAYFEKEDADENGYYELPVSPVTTADASLTVSVSGVSTTYQVKGLKIKKVKPDNVIGTISVGADTTGSYYMTVEFAAGESDTLGSQLIKEVAGIMFDNRSLEMHEAYLPYHTRKMIEDISNNVL